MWSVYWTVADTILQMQNKWHTPHGNLYNRCVMSTDVSLCKSKSIWKKNNLTEQWNVQTDSAVTYLILPKVMLYLLLYISHFKDVFLNVYCILWLFTLLQNNISVITIRQVLGMMKQMEAITLGWYCTTCVYTHDFSVMLRKISSSPVNLLLLWGESKFLQLKPRASSGIAVVWLHGFQLYCDMV